MNEKTKAAYHAAAKAAKAGKAAKAAEVVAKAENKAAYKALVAARKEESKTANAFAEMANAGTDSNDPLSKAAYRAAVEAARAAYVADGADAAARKEYATARDAETAARYEASAKVVALGKAVKAEAKG